MPTRKFFYMGLKGIPDTLWTHLQLGARRMNR